VKGHSDTEGNLRAGMLARSLLDDREERICALATHYHKLQDNNKEIESLKTEIRQGLHKNLVVDGGTVFYVDPKPDGMEVKRIYVPSNARGYLLELAHDNPIYGGHLGIKKTFRKLMKFWWPKQHSDVEQYVRSCETCQKFKNPVGPTPGYLHSIPVSAIFQHIHIDIIGPIHTTCRGNRYIITAIDAFSKWAYAQACQSVATQTVISFVEDQILSKHGMPEVIISDQGSQFTSREWQAFVKKYGFKHNTTTPYHPQSNGIDERFNGTISRILRCYTDYFQEEWDESLKWALFVYNTTVHDPSGHSPYQILHGVDARSPLKGAPDNNSSNITFIDQVRDAIRKSANAAITASQDKQRMEYDARHRRFEMKIGDLVMEKEHSVPEWISKKLAPKWSGPNVIVGFVGDPDHPRAAEILNCSRLKRKTVALSNIKLFLTRDPKLCRSPTNGTDRVEPEEDHSYSAGDFVNLERDEQQDNSREQTTVSPGASNSQHKDRKRVTIDESTETIIYDPNDTISDYSEALNDLGALNDSERHGKLQGANDLNYVSPYVDEINIDDEDKDPTFDPGKVDGKTTSGDQSAANTDDHSDLSTTISPNQLATRPIPYNLRKTKYRQAEVGPIQEGVSEVRKASREMQGSTKSKDALLIQLAELGTEDLITL